jgi:hypothetical protein
VHSATAGGFAGSLCLSAPALSSAVGEGGLGLEEATYRLYHCGRCAVQVSICRRCDHGNLYCRGKCAQLARRESLRRAGARYQRTFRGACRHAARQRRYRERRAKVTHHRFSGCAAPCSVSARAHESIDVEPEGPHELPLRVSPTRCTFCGTQLPAFARVAPWRWSG